MLGGGVHKDGIKVVIAFWPLFGSFNASLNEQEQDMRNKTSQNTQGRTRVTGHNEQGDETWSD